MHHFAAVARFLAALDRPADIGDDLPWVTLLVAEGSAQRPNTIGLGRLFRDNIMLPGGPAPVWAYIDELLPDVLEGHI